MAEAVTTKTHCPYCAFQCGMTVTVGPSGGVQVRPDDDFPVNRGQMCTKGFTSGELLDHVARLTTPLVRGRDGRLASASWTSALDFVGERLGALRERGSPGHL